MKTGFHPALVVAAGARAGKHPRNVDRASEEAEAFMGSPPFGYD